MPHNLTDSSTFTDPVAAPADGDSDEQATYDPAFQALANRTRYLKDQIFFPTPPTRHVIVDLATGIGGGADFALSILGPTTALKWVSAGSDGSHAGIVFPLDAMLRDGMVITDVKFAIKPGVARSTTARMSAGLYYQIPDWSTASNNPVNPVAVAETTDDSSANKQIASLASALGAGHTVVRDHATAPRGYYLLAYTGDTHATYPDSLYGIELVFTDPGPRNQ